MLELIEKFDIKTILEIGTCYGYTAKLLSEFPGVGRVVSIDNRNVIKYPGNYEFIQVKSEDFVPEKFDMVFIDGDHSKTAVTNDYAVALKCNPKLILFHDADLSDVAEALKELNKNFVYLKAENHGKNVESNMGGCELAYEQFN